MSTASQNPYPPRALPGMGANELPLSGPEADPMPDPPAPAASKQDATIRAFLAIGLPFSYVAMLVFLAVEWLNFGHPNLEAPVIGGFGLLAGWAGTEFSHFSGDSNTTHSFLTGLHSRK